MSWRLLLGLMLIAIAMLVDARARRGAVIAFLRGREGLQSIYAMSLILLFVLGVSVALSSMG